MEAIKCAALAVAAVAVSACATPRFNYEAVAHDISDPPIGSTQTRSVGDELLKQGTFREQEALELPEIVKIGLLTAYTFTPGHYLKHGETGQGSFFAPSNERGSGRVIKAALADPFKSILVPKNGGSVCGVTVLNAKVCTKAKYRLIKLPIATPDSFQQTLIYSGNVGSKINVGYRESSGNLARPAFNNDVEYDLSASKTIGYKGAALEVLSADNQVITYRVIRNFNRAQ